MTSGAEVKNLGEGLVGELKEEEEREGEEKGEGGDVEEDEGWL